MYISKKQIITILFTLFIVFSFQNAKAQKVKFIADTITIKLQNGVVMKTLLNYNQKFGTFAKENKIDDQFTSLLNKVEVLKIDEAFLATPRKLILRNNRKQYLYDDKSKEEFLISDNQSYTKLLHVMESDQFFLQQAKHEAIIEAFHYKTIFFFHDLAQLKELGTYDFKSIIAKTESAIQTSIGGYNKPFYGIMDIYAKQNDDGNVSIVSYNMPKTSSPIYLNGGVGTELIKQNLVGDIRLSLMISYNKGLYNNYAAFGLFSESKLSFQEDEREMNHFLGLGYYRNVSQTLDKSLWVGINAGMLVKRDGDLFKKNTWFVGTPGYRNKGLSLEPRLYFEGAFENVMPSIRLGVTF